MRWFYETAVAVNADVNSSKSASGMMPPLQAEASLDGEELSISQMAQSFDVSMRTLRFYESKGLLQPRRIGNRRFYNESCRTRLRLVLKGKRMGFGLDEIADLVGVVESGQADLTRAQDVLSMCEQQRELLNARRDVLNQQIDETNRVIDELTAL